MAALLFTGAGVISAITWTKAKQFDSNLGRDDYARNYDAALTMAALCLILGIVYFVDFIVAIRARRRFRTEPYWSFDVKRTNTLITRLFLCAATESVTIFFLEY